ncbi:HEAT repeat domain-containing protein [Thiolapillus sp.]
MNEPADTLLLIAPGCPHCQSVLHSLSELVKNGIIGRLEVINIAVHPQAAQQVNTRTVPWMRIGNYELRGNYSPGELKRWAEKAARDAGSADYIRELLERQELNLAIRHLKEHTEKLPQLLELMQEEDISLSVKFGIGAIFEALENSGLLEGLLPQLGALTRSNKANLRADAAYYLGLSHSPQARKWLTPLLQDPQQDVREIAAESLDMLETRT